MILGASFCRRRFLSYLMHDPDKSEQLMLMFLGLLFAEQPVRHIAPPAIERY
jgi:hypothetical protein